MASYAQVVADFAVSIGFIAFVVAVIIGLVKGWFKTFGELRDVTRKTNAFIVNIVPSILEGFEERKIVGKGVHAQWTRIVSSPNYIQSQSPNALNDHGRKLLMESGIKDIVDSDLVNLIKDVEAKNPQNPLDVENLAFYVLQDKEDEVATKKLKTYIFNNPQISMDILLLVGSMYLRDKYFEKYPDLLKNE